MASSRWHGPSSRRNWPSADPTKPITDYSAHRHVRAPVAISGAPIGVKAISTAPNRTTQNGVRDFCPDGGPKAGPIWSPRARRSAAPALTCGHCGRSSNPGRDRRKALCINELDGGGGGRVRTGLRGQYSDLQEITGKFHIFGRPFSARHPRKRRKVSHLAANSREPEQGIF
jgi:hypothetical protein